MGYAKVNKYIDLNQFPRDKNGNISWKDSVGMIVDFYYYDKKHTIKIINYISIDYVEIKVDDMPSEIVGTQKIRHLNFDSLFYKPKYFYNVGDIVNGFVIIEQLYINKSSNSKYKSKHYKCKCLVDEHEYIFSEIEIKDGKKCPMCTCLATTNPEIIKFLLDKEDGYKYTKGSHKYIWAICPFCGYKKLIKVEDLVYNGLSCSRCSDGLSYPNKFAYNVFEQLCKQYASYDCEYSPDWAGRMRYDNHIVFEDGQEIVVEMDGGFHYNEYGKWASQNDVIKNALAEEHGIKVIRVNCFYNQIANRFNLIKDNFINSLKQYFDLSNIDWESADNAGVSNRLVEVVNYYNEHPFTPMHEIVDHFHLSHCTIRNYIVAGEELGLCKYIKNDPNRSKTSIPLALYNKDGNYIGAYISANQLAKEFTDEKFVGASVSQFARLGMPYKGYIIKRITWDEYESLQNKLKQGGVANEQTVY